MLLPRNPNTTYSPSTVNSPSKAFPHTLHPRPSALTQLQSPKQRALKLLLQNTQPSSSVISQYTFKKTESDHELVTRTKQELQQIFEEKGLEKELLRDVDEAMTLRELLAAVVQVVRRWVLVGKEKEGGKEKGQDGDNKIKDQGQEKNDDQGTKDSVTIKVLKETVETLRSSQSWAKKKLQQMKSNWKSSCQQIRHLQNQVQDSQSQIFQLQTHQSHTQKFISHMQDQFRKLIQRKGLPPTQHLLQQNRRLNRTVSDLQLQKDDLKRLVQGKGHLISQLEAINERKDRELEYLNEDLVFRQRELQRSRKQETLGKKLGDISRRFREKYEDANTESKHKHRSRVSLYNHQSPKFEEPRTMELRNILARSMVAGEMGLDRQRTMEEKFMDSLKMTLKQADQEN